MENKLGKLSVGQRTRLLNFRDLGNFTALNGQRIPSKTLLRSASLAGLSTEEVLLAPELGNPGTYIDLRTECEIQRDGAPQGLAEAGWMIANIAIEDRRGTRDRLLPPDERLLERYSVAVLKVLRAMAFGPVLISCSLGKDRTGVVCAVALASLGIRHSDVRSDYLASNLSLTETPDLLPARWRNRPLRSVHGDDLDGVLHLANLIKDTDVARKARQSLLRDWGRGGSGNFAR